MSSFETRPNVEDVLQGFDKSYDALSRPNFLTTMRGGKKTVHAFGSKIRLTRDIQEDYSWDDEFPVVLVRSAITQYVDEAEQRYSVYQTLEEEPIDVHLQEGSMLGSELDWYTDNGYYFVHEQKQRVGVVPVRSWVEQEPIDNDEKLGVFCQHLTEAASFAAFTEGAERPMRGIL